MSEDQTNKTTGGVWVACSERLPKKRHGDLFGIVAVKTPDKTQECEIGRLLWSSVSDDCMYGYTHWLDTTVEIVTREEHEAAIAKLHAQYGCELRDPNGTIWEQTAKLQKENEELKKKIVELEEVIMRLRDTIKEFDESW